MRSGELLVIGLCGRSGSGKGYVSAVFEKHGIPAVDTDRVYRDILADKSSECLSELIAEYGGGILDRDGRLERRSLAGIVFGDKSGEKLKRLNDITHKYILEKTKDLIDKARESKKRAIIIDAPVLFESGFDKLCDLTVCVTAPDSICIKRICERDGRTESEAAKRLSSQKSADELRITCNEEIVNDGAENVESRVLEIMKKYGLGGADEE
ncbi:MAG: dephospho-CoA kinase [Clostridia bacterium]|nr:dephospho-CoA kinase [Clostridia bacterium]